MLSMLPRTTRRRLKRCRRWCVYGLLRLAYYLLRFGPRSLLLVVVAIGHQFVFAFDRRDRNIMRRNLRLAFPEKSEAWRDRVARRVFLNLGRGAVDMLVVHRHPSEPTARRVPMRVDWEAYCRALAERGAVTVSGHVGCWELLASSCGQCLRDRVAVMARRIYFPPFNDWVVSMREAFGTRVFFQDESPRKVIRFLRERNVLGILPDQDVKDLSGIFVPFFGIDAWTPTGPVALALTSGVPIFVTYLVWDGRAYRLESEGPLPLPNTGSRAEDVRILTARWTRMLERVVRKYPDQWVWFHRRWRRRPRADG